MTLFQQIDRVKYIHYLIHNRATGEPENFAEKLNLSRRQLYNILDELKDFGVEIKYSRMQQTFYYEYPFVLEINVKIQQLEYAECEAIYGGVNLVFINRTNIFRAIKLHGSSRPLPL